MSLIIMIGRVEMKLQASTERQEAFEEHSAKGFKFAGGRSFQLKCDNIKPASRAADRLATGDRLQARDFKKVEFLPKPILQPLVITILLNFNREVNDQLMEFPRVADIMIVYKII